MNDELAVRRVWKNTPTPEIDELARRLAAEAVQHDYDLDLDEILFLAFAAGYAAREPG
jgi:hypothetical protein